MKPESAETNDMLYKKLVRNGHTFFQLCMGITLVGTNACRNHGYVYYQGCPICNEILVTVIYETSVIVCKMFGSSPERQSLTKTYVQLAI